MRLVPMSLGSSLIWMAKEPISLGIWLTADNGLFDELGSAFHRLWWQRQEADEFWLHRIGGDSLDIGGLEGP
jgi:hypothetical protein